MERISLTKRQETFWSRWGELRGGSASRPINSNEYLTFFHTTTLLPKSQRTSYFMGALTFSRNSPFIIKRISAVPIMHPSFYVGDWMRQRFDYCYYSQAFVFSYYDEKVILLFIVTTIRLLYPPIPSAELYQRPLI